MLSEIGHSVAQDVNWSLIFYITFAVIVMIVLDKAVGVSFPKLVQTVFREFREFSAAKFTAGAINMAGVLLVVALCAAYFLSSAMKDVIQFLAAAQGQELGEDGPGEMFCAIGAIGVLLIASVLIVLAGERGTKRAK